jgi:hypothetical protein
MNEKQSINRDKIELLESLLSVYRKEIEVIYAINISWEQLKDEAKAQCAEDFDQAIKAREILLEELAELRDAGFVPDKFEFSLFTIDQHLLDQHSLVNEMYGLDVHSFLNVKKPKGLLKAKK